MGGGVSLVGVLVGLLGSLLITWQYHINTDPQPDRPALPGPERGICNCRKHLPAASASGPDPDTSAGGLCDRLSQSGRIIVFCAAGLHFVANRVPGIRRLRGGRFGERSAVRNGTLFRRFSGRGRQPGGCVIRLRLPGRNFDGGDHLFRGISCPADGALAIVPLVYFAIYARNDYPAALEVVRHRRDEAAMRETLRDLRSIAAVLFSLLLFFQFGNEWAIAGWLPLFLIHRFGSNPVWAISGLVIYFVALMVGRLAAQPLLSRVKHRKLLLGSIMAAMLGYLLLSLTTTMTGALVAVVVIGAGFAPIYPLVAENLDDRFSYHPGFYNGIFSIAITGAMSAPWLLGYVDEYLGIRYVMLIPALGSIVVFVLALLIMLEAHVMGGTKAGEKTHSAAAGGNG